MKYVGSIADMCVVISEQERPESTVYYVQTKTRTNNRIVPKGLYP